MSPLLLISVLLIFAAVGAVVFTVLSQLEGYEVENQRDQQMLDPLRDRALAPVLEGLTGVGRRLTPVGYVEKVRQKFVHMGNTSPQAVDRFLAIRVATVVGAALVFFFVFVVNVTGLTGKMQLAAGVLLMLLLL